MDLLNHCVKLLTGNQDKLLKKTQSNLLLLNFRCVKSHECCEIEIQTE